MFAESKYLLSEPEEKIMNLKSPSSHANWVKMTSGFLAKEERTVILVKAEERHETFSDIAESDEQQAEESPGFCGKGIQ